MRVVKDPESSTWSAAPIKPSPSAIKVPAVKVPAVKGPAVKVPALKVPAVTLLVTFPAAMEQATIRQEAVCHAEMCQLTVRQTATCPAVRR